ncbi:acyl-CoA dehydrogenase family protein [Haematobacter genomosp. 1]|uniref:3-sulfinopropanoyl-CoA desulfinase n=1 Tax=Haematobacter genomosp. 1 TaxID=366618 RepID=A0A212ADW0_9RHOB|nr:acyl-CoA dehydrogenase family protein [Haematobacter genomosp. 1]OWJ79316.1 acyl-CoA dehydrogenase [Haematobacter genomosp. 1]
MDAFCTDDDMALGAMVERFARERLAPAAQGIDEQQRFAGEHLPALAEIGLTGLNLPERHGGAGASPVALYLAVEALASACASTTSMLTAHYLATDSILIGGSEEQRARFLVDAAAGTKLGAFGLTEPKAGSNPTDMTTRATREGSAYRLNGTKHFISNAGHADFIVVYAITDQAAGARGISAFVVERGISGLSVGPAEPTMGLRGGHVFEVSFDGCLVPEENRLGEEGSGFRTAMKVLDNGRIEVTATCTGIARAAVEAAVSWAKQREIDGAPIARFQGLQWMLADMAVDLDASRLLGLRAAQLRAQGQRFSAEAARAKLHASEMAGRVTDKALQIHGGYGYSRHMPLERYARDARIMRIYEGSSEIQRNIIARNLLA